MNDKSHCERFISAAPFFLFIPNVLPICHKLLHILLSCENKLCYFLLSSEDGDGLGGEMSRTRRKTGAEYSQLEKSISEKLLLAEIRGCRGSRDWFLFCSLCFCSIRVCGEEKHGLGIGMEMVCCFGGKKVAKFLLHFSNVIFMHIFPFSLRGDVFDWDQEGNNKFKRQKTHNKVVWICK